MATVVVTTTYKIDDKDIKKTQKSLKKLNKEGKDAIGIGKKLANGFKGLGKSAAIAGAAVVGLGTGLFFAAEKAIAVLDTIVKTSRALGISAKAYQELGFAAQQAGSSQEELEKGIQKLSKSLGDLRTGDQIAADAFAQIGLTETALAGKEVDEVLELVVIRLAELKDASVAASVSSDLLGKRNFRLKNLGEAGAEGIRALREEAQALGLVFSDELLSGSEDAADALNIMKRVVSAQFITALAQLAPTIVNIGNAFAGWVKEALPAVERMVLDLENLSLQALALELEDVTKEIVRAEAALAAANASSTGFNWLDSVIGTPEDIKAKQQALDELVTKAQSIQGLIDDANKPKPILSKAEGTETEIAGVKLRQQEAEENARQRKLDALQREALQIRLNAEAIILSSKSEEEQIRGNSQLRIDELNRDLEAFKGTEQQKVELARITSEAIVAIEDNRNTELTELNNQRLEDIKAKDAEELTLWKEKNAGLVKSTQAFTDQSADALTTYLQTGKFEFKQFASSIINDLIRIWVQQQVTGLFGAAGGGGLFGALFGPGGGGTTASAKGNVFASGGVVSSPSRFPMQGGTGTVAERGAEAILPLSRDAQGRLGVANNGGGGGNVISINTTINVEGAGNDENLAEEIRRKVVPDILNKVKEEMSKENRPGGSFNPVSSVGR